VRVRQFELRLLALALTVLWAVGGGIVLIAYRPGGPLDVAVGLAASLPLLLGLAALVWPPLVRNDRVTIVIFAVGLGAGLLLLPSIANIAAQVIAGGTQPLMPSLEVVYPWALALAATSLFTGLGVSRRLVNGSGLGRWRIATSAGFALVFTTVIAGTFAGVTLADEAALRDAPAVYSHYGPTTPEVVPPECAMPLTTPSTARLSVQLWADVDGRSAGQADISGVRSGDDFYWTAQVVRGSDLFARYGSARTGVGAWRMGVDGRWIQVSSGAVDMASLDGAALAVLLSPGNRATAENRGLEYVEGARARHCRITVDGDTFVASFPQETWLLGSADLDAWRGEINYWVFGDGEVGRIEGSVNGEAQGIMPGLLATINVRLTATDRDTTIYVPTPEP
jgi:hypothetical protein